MWKTLVDLLRWVVTLNEETRQNRSDIEQIQREMREISISMERLAYEVRLLQEVHRRDQENLSLRLNNVLLEFEKRLPAPESNN